MDFRLIQPEAVVWGSAWYRGAPQARLKDGGGRVQVQTPLAGCTVRVAGAGMYRVELGLRPNVASHVAFREWIDAMEEAASEAPDLAEYRVGKSRSSTVYNNTMRLMMFSDTMAFDRTGAMSADFVGAAACACLVELQGCWGTDSRWGLRWKIVQLKFDVVCPAFPPMMLDDDAVPAPAAAYDFVDE